MKLGCKLSHPFPHSTLFHSTSPEYLLCTSHCLALRTLHVGQRGLENLSQSACALKSDFFFFSGCPCGVWKFPGQGLNVSHSCSNARSFNPLHQAGIEAMPLQWSKPPWSNSSPTVSQRELQSWPLWAVWPWTNYLAFQCFHFLIRKLEKPTIKGLDKFIRCKVFSTVASTVITCDCAKHRVSPGLRRWGKLGSSRCLRCSV